MADDEMIVGGASEGKAADDQAAFIKDTPVRIRDFGATNSSPVGHRSGNAGRQPLLHPLTREIGSCQMQSGRFSLHFRKREGLSAKG